LTRIKVANRPSDDGYPCWRQSDAHLRLRPAPKGTIMGSLLAALTILALIWAALSFYERAHEQAAKIKIHSRAARPRAH
jgi:hypothetical protein